MEQNFSTKSRKEISVNIPVLLPFLPLATSFVEKGAIAMGLEDSKSIEITIAVEEIFTYLCGITSGDQSVEIRCSGREYYIVVEIIFVARELNIRVFNITETISPEEESGLAEMGLLIASRFVDRLRVNLDEVGKYRLALIKERSYPEPAEEPLPETGDSEDSVIKKPEPEELKLLSRLVREYYRNKYYPGYLMYPGKLVDMVKSGEYSAAIALDSAGRIGGGIIWHWSGNKTVECSGPYLFYHNRESAISRALVEECLARIAKTSAIGLINRYPSEDLPQDYFELLGELAFFDKNGNTLKIPAYHRQLHEDPGASVWAHPDMEQYLRAEYDRLVFPREIRLVKDEGERTNMFSVLSADFNKSQGTVTIHPVQSGKDISKNLGKHLYLFEKESYKTVFFEMDLGISWHTAFAPSLIKEGFTPRLILPHAGWGDIVVFQKEGTSI